METFANKITIQGNLNTTEGFLKKAVIRLQKQYAEVAKSATKENKLIDGQKKSKIKKNLTKRSG